MAPQEPATRACHNPPVYPTTQLATQATTMHLVIATLLATATQPATQATATQLATQAIAMQPAMLVTATQLAMPAILPEQAMHLHLLSRSHNLTEFHNLGLPNLTSQSQHLPCQENLLYTKLQAPGLLPHIEPHPRSHCPTGNLPNPLLTLVFPPLHRVNFQPPSILPKTFHLHRLLKEHHQTLQNLLHFHAAPLL